MMNFFSHLMYAITSPIYTLLSSPLSIISAPRKLFGMSLPTRVAVFVFIFLILLTIASYAVFLQMPGRAAADVFKGWQRTAAVALLLIAIPIVVYYALKLWLEEDVSRFEDIDKAWRAGIKELSSNGIELTEWPLFVVIGPADQQEAKTLLEASGIDQRIPMTPDQAAPLYWFAGSQGIFLVCTNAGRLSCLNGIAAKGVQLSRGMAPPDPGGQGEPVRYGTMDFGQNQPVPDDGDSMSSIIEPGGMGGRPGYLGAGTMKFPDQAGVTAPLPTGPIAPRVAAVRLPKDQALLQSARLQYVCELIRHARMPVCPINGILTVLPFSLIDRTDEEGIEMKNAIREDLEVMHATFRLRCQVIAMVAGMEREAGFRELMRRVGKDAARLQRFGKGFRIWNYPIPEQVEAVATHACAAFEDWTYALFREKDGLMKELGNKKLYSLLCKIRSKLTLRIKNIVVDGFACDEQPEQDEVLPLLFSGCYFSATGDKADRQAFVKNVFERLVEQEEELDWTEPAVRENASYQRIANLALVLSVLLFLGMGGMLIKKYYWTST